MTDDRPSVPDALSDPDTIRALHEGRAQAGSDTAAGEQTPADHHKTRAKEWLGDLMLLQGVPFPYLVPDDRVLPQNALRLFHVDRNWVKALLEGATSVGRDHAADTAHDAVFDDELTAAARRAATTIRARLLGQALPEETEATDGDASPSPSQVPPMTGFLLRSVAVSDWPGLRAKAKDKNDNDLPLLRFERLSKSILLGIFKGRLHRLRLGRAVETLHFGLSDENGQWAVSLRNPKTGKPTGTSVRTPMRNDRTVQAGALAKKMAGTLNGGDFTSADFALQMVQSTKEVWFEPSSAESSG